MSDTGESQPQQNFGKIPLLRPILGKGERSDFLEPNPEHPKFPTQWLQDFEARFYADLDEDEEFQAEVAAAAQLIAPELGPNSVDSITNALARMSLNAAAWEEITGNVEPAEHFRGVLMALNDRLRNAASTLGRHDVPFAIRLRYLAVKALPPGIVKAVSPYETSPVTMLVNTSDSEYILQVIPPGATLMTFNGIAVRDVIRLMTPFLTESQRVSKHAQHLRRGGKKLDPELSIRAYAKYQEVKEFPTEARRLIAVAGALRLAKSGENETDQKVKKRVARLVAAGRREEEDRRHAKREQEAKTGHLPSTGDVSV